MNEVLGNLLDLPPIEEEDIIGFHNSPMVLPDDEKTRKEVVQIGEDNIMFHAQVDSHSSRANMSMNATGKTYQYAAKSNKENTSILTMMIEETKDLPCGPYVEEFNKYLIKLATRNTIGYINISSAKIAQELTKPPLPPLIQTKSQRFFAKLLGK